ncbi:MAG: hypothetical protein ACP5E3_16150, partial [Bacteroidales bacterium]
ITVSPDQPQAVIHYEYRGVYPAELFIRFKSNQRLMWPYSEDVPGGMNYTFHQKLNAYILTDPSGDFVSIPESTATNILTGRTLGEGSEAFPRTTNNGVIHGIDKVLTVESVDTGE